MAVESVTTIGGGYSKHTILVAAKVGGEHQEIVLRQVPPGQPDATLATGTLSPRLAAVVAWLKANIPDRTTASIVHGDVGLHNALADGGRLTAVLDWERAHLGDPVEDLAYLRPSIEPVFPWEEFIDRYVAQGATDVIDDDEKDSPDSDTAALRQTLKDLQAKVDQLTELQLQAAKK